MKKLNIVLIRGLTRESGHWGDTPQAFAKKIPHAKLIYLDIPGNGVHHKLSTPTTIWQMVEFMRSELRSKIEPAYNLLVTFSLGGMIATAWIYKYPKDFDKAVIINSSLGGYSNIFKRLRFENSLRFMQLALTSSIEEKEKIILQIISNDLKNFESNHKKWTEIQKLRPVTLLNTFKQLMAGATYRPPKKSPPIPVLLLNSIKDRLVNSACSVDIHKAWKVPLKTHLTAGHDIPLDDPEWTVNQIANFLNVPGNICEQSHQLQMTQM